MAQRAQRAFALILAVLFLFTSVATTAAILYQVNRDNKTAQSEQEAAANSSKGKEMEDFEPVAKVTTLKIVDIKKGDGKTVKAGDTVTAHYTGAVAATGIIFESSKDIGQPATFPLDNVIKGWQQGVPGMKEGGTRRLIIPAELAYGEQSPSADIPPNSALVFDIELVSVR